MSMLALQRLFIGATGGATRDGCEVSSSSSHSQFDLFGASREGKLTGQGDFIRRNWGPSLVVVFLRIEREVGKAALVLAKAEFPLGAPVFNEA